MSSIYDKSSLVLIPSGTKTGKVFSQKPVSGDGDFTFTRASAATRVNADGNIEKETQNLLLQSNNFSNGWSQNLASVTSGQSGYDGTNDAWTLTATDPFGNIARGVTATGVLTLSVYMKAGDLSWGRLRFDNYPSGDVNVWVNLSTGALGSDNSIAAYTEDAGGGWWRVVCQTNTTDLDNVRFYPADGSGSNATAGYIYIQDAQLEQGLVARDVITTTTAAVYGGITDNTPRLDYTDSSCPSLLLEPQRTNIFDYSEYFSGSYWAKTGTGGGNAPIVTQNYAVSPEGLQNASRVQFDTNGSSSGDRSGLVRDFAFTTGDKYAISCWVKSASGSDEIFTLRIAGAQVGGEKIATSEWQLFTETHTATATTTDNFGMQIRGNYSSQTSDILIYGMQLESAVSYPTSYIPTYGSSVTRNVDVGYNSSAASVIGQGEGTIYIETIPLDDLTSYTERLIQFESAGSDFMTFQRYNNGNITFYGTDGTNTWTIQALNVFSGGTTTKIAGAYKVNDVVLYANGQSKGTDTSIPTMPNCDRVWFANNASGSLLYIGKHTKVMFFPTRLSNEELAALTTI